MANTTYLASRRNGTRTGCGPGSVRLSVTIPEETFVALRERAGAAGHGLSGEIAEILKTIITEE